MIISFIAVRQAERAQTRATAGRSTLATNCRGAITVLVFAQRFQFWPAVVWIARAVAMAQVAVLAGYWLSGLQQPWLVGFSWGTAYTLLLQAALTVYCLTRHRNLTSAGLTGVFVLVYALMAASLLSNQQLEGLSLLTEIDIFVLRALLIPVFMACLFMILEADRAAGQARLSAAGNDALVLAAL